MFRLRRSLAAILAIVFMSCSTQEDPTIGVVLPLTGDLAVYGEKIRNGIELALREFDAAGTPGRRQLRVIYEDDKGEPKTAISALQKLQTVDRVPLVIGGATSSTALAMVPVAERGRTVLVSPSATSPQLSGASSFFFRIWPSDVYEGEVMADFVTKQLRLARVAILYVNNDWGVGISRVFADAIKKSGLVLTASESFEVGATDFRTTLLKVSASKPEAFYIIGYIKELVPLLRQKSELRLSQRLLGSSGFFDPAILTQTAAAAEGCVFVVPAYDPASTDSPVRDFVAAYDSAFGTPPDVWAAHGYDTMRLVAQVVSQPALDLMAIQQRLRSTSNFQGVTGNISFDENGDVQKPLRFLQIRGERFVTLDIR